MRFCDQRWQFRVIGEISNIAATAKTPLHEKDLKVAELVLSGAAKGLRHEVRAFLYADCAPIPVANSHPCGELWKLGEPTIWRVTGVTSL